ncbi:hypothetical protein DSL72_003317 [Monilinia vaccinii-corymbosi]|uniref:ubiquitinyl hydrolase 1 n=1 Tax=Monilinia vaccinii-corymbosi TaxID=61207 RepID=A0A8A3NWJ5_9HELO|nr:hypothetical protein DSL72_003317 [Monilinia vaccinii-corymbosi]
MATSTNALLESLINHIVLPPRLPGTEDKNELLGVELMGRFIAAAKVMRDIKGNDLSKNWDWIRRSLEIAKFLNAQGSLTKASLLSEFRDLQPNVILMLYVLEQNAALLISRNTSAQGQHQVLFEVFETSPASEAVLAAENALQWDFPGYSVEIPFSTFEQSSFLEELAKFLEKASTESIKQFTAKTIKAGSKVVETRDTSDCAIISSCLMTLLEANGRRVFPPVLRKRVRDDVCWFDSAKPWRRHPLYLVLRVGLQRRLATLGEAGRIQYKFLISVILTHLLEESLREVDLETLSFLKTKLCRRLAKLEFDADQASTSINVAYEQLFTSLRPRFQKAVQDASHVIDAAWTSFKKNDQRPILPLPTRADQCDMFLTLPNSGRFLRHIITESFHPPTGLNGHGIPAADVAIATKQLDAFANSYLSLYASEAANRRLAAPSPALGHEEKCMLLADRIGFYLRESRGKYLHNAEGSSAMILNIMDLWMAMDKSAVTAYPLLKKYHPCFTPEMLDILQVPLFEDMCRLKDIQSYIQIRCQDSTANGPSMSIYEDPVKGCFGERYFDQSTNMSILQERIRTETVIAYEKKQKEWEELSEEHRKLREEHDSLTCIFKFDEVLLEEVHDDDACKKCFLRRKARRIKIQVREFPLPANPAEEKVIIFELSPPKPFLSYRNATWNILNNLAFPRKQPGPNLLVPLQDYSGVQHFVTRNDPGVCLGSFTKSFLMTHYDFVKFPTQLDKVFVNNGLTFSYYDTISNSNLKQQWKNQKPTFAHHFEIILPPNSPFSFVMFKPESFAVGSKGPSSYEVIASQSTCPSQLNVHEYMAFQSLFSGKTRRLTQLLVELGSQNLNFSTEAALVIVSRLILEAGPAAENDPLRVIHRSFQDTQFCDRLVELLSQRLENISSNWRENLALETILTIILRLTELAPISIQARALTLLEKVRMTTSKWLSRLRADMMSKAADADTIKRCMRYALWAALLCRRTFAFHSQRRNILDSDNLRCFIEASIMLQYVITGDPAGLPNSVRNAIVRDLRAVYDMRSILQESLKVSPEALVVAAEIIWPQSNESPRTISDLRFLGTEGSQNWWVQATISAINMKQQTLSYQIVLGHLYIDSQPLGKLPPEIRTYHVLKTLFGDTNLLAFPSANPGSIYTLATCHNDHQIHIGFRDGSPVVRACSKGTVLELIPPETFKGPDQKCWDLPSPLINNCVHWLNRGNGIIEIRHAPDYWKYKPSNWQLNVRNQTCTRRRSTLVDPHAPLFKSISRIFDSFELPGELIVYQPVACNLSVELKRLALTFSVNKKNLLQSKQLRAEIDRDQNCGTWYGLRSKIVIRDIHNPRQRSLIVPIITGPESFKIRRNGVHIQILIDNGGIYGRFYINEVLGRLDCPAEPLLIYMKAMIHAYTSFILVDELTGRTGAEEAVAFLKSGLCQPWLPLHAGSLSCLNRIAALCPTREYYPRDGKAMQKVSWNDSLTTAIQYDGYHAIIGNIILTSTKLNLFSSQKIEQITLPKQQSHLVQRSHARFSRFVRLHSEVWEVAPDSIYDSRDKPCASQKRTNILESVGLILRQPQKIRTTKDLVGIFQAWSNVSGLTGKYEKVLLTDSLEVNFILDFGGLVRSLQAADQTDKFRLQFLFSLLSFRDNIDMNLIRVLIAYSVWNDLKILEPPKWPSYIKFRQNQIPHLASISQLLKPCLIPYPGDERDSPFCSLNSKQRRVLEQQEEIYDRKGESDCQLLARFFLDQWPCPEPTTVGFRTAVQINVELAQEIICPEWKRLSQNFELSKYLEQVQEVLNRNYTEEVFRPDVEVKLQEVFPIRCHGIELPVLADVLCKVGAPSQLSKIEHFKENIQPTLNNIPASSPKGPKKVGRIISQEVLELGRIISTVISSSVSLVRRNYMQELQQSLSAYKLFEQVPKTTRQHVDPLNLPGDIEKLKRLVLEIRNCLRKSFETNSSGSHWLQEAQLFPCISTITLLESLRSTSNIVFASGLRESLVEYAVHITTLQRFLRLEEAFNKGDEQRLVEEQTNIGHENWDPMKETDWLLLELEANVLIRPQQVEVARATICPASKSNSVLQLNMGQGKTSIIIPMVAAKLADAERLFRVIVPKSLLQQTGQLLQGRLGSILGRSLLHIPISRKSPMDVATIRTYYAMHERILQQSGVVLALPENILSFGLSSLQRLADGRIQEGNEMVKVQRWMDKNCRDVMDESDQILSLRTQLIYPSGTQKTVDGNRWQTAQGLLHLVEGHLFYLQETFPHSIEVIQRPGRGFPIVHFTRRDAEEALLNRIALDVLNGRTSILNMAVCTNRDHLAIKKFITEERLSPSVLKQVRRVFPDNPGLQQNLHLLRGLIVHRILLTALKKKWQVQYGLPAPPRDPIAVPYHAKGVPSDNAEWGHPDVAIVLTCLTYYYDGLNTAQLRRSFEHILKSGDPASEYDRWTTNTKRLPDSLKDLNSINLEDESQMGEILLYLRFEVAIIDYFLNNFVFPKFKQFCVKLQASGWDIPLSSQNNANALTTGFSGTNDNRSLLPLTLRQQDLNTLKHTNAEVLTYLLQERNRGYVVASNDQGRHISEHDLLVKIKSMGIRVLIDAGAQFLELDNVSLARAWLIIDYEAQACVYFDEAGKPQVIYQRAVHPVPLLASHFADNLTGCLIYFSEANCRGVDLKMPVNARAALTLGLAQSKDSTVQAAMRLRQLATTQAVVFFAPPEVHQSILDLRGKTHNDFIDSYDVICWLLEQTINGIEKLQPLYYSQGKDYCRRMQAASDYNKFFTNPYQCEKYLNAIREVEALSVQQLYGPQKVAKPMDESEASTPRTAGFAKLLNMGRKAFLDTGNAVESLALSEVEVEREVAYEVEAVREVQKPVHYPALSFPGLHKDIITFAKTGRLPADSSSYEQVFRALRKTGVGLRYGINENIMTSRLYVSSEFLRSVNVIGSDPHDNFQRQVSWILWSTVTESALVVIPEESELLIPILKNMKAPICHLLTYAAPLTRRMLHFNDLRFYAIPALPEAWQTPTWLTIELGIYAGRLYFNWSEYELITKFLGVSSMKPNQEVDDNAVANTPTSGIFTAKPLTFLQEWLHVRRKGQDFEHTPMGHVCQGKILIANHPFFSSKKEMEDNALASGMSGVVGEDNAADLDDKDEDALDDDDLMAKEGNSSHFSTSETDSTDE